MPRMRGRNLTPLSLIPSDFVPLAEVSAQVGVPVWTCRSAGWRDGLPSLKVRLTSRRNATIREYARPQDVERVMVTRKGLVSNYAV